MKTCSTLLINKENSDVKRFLSVQLAKFKRKANIHCHGVALEIVEVIWKNGSKALKWAQFLDSKIILIKYIKL